MVATVAEGWRRRHFTVESLTRSYHLVLNMHVKGEVADGVGKGSLCVMDTNPRALATWHRVTSYIPKFHGIVVVVVVVVVVDAEARDDMSRRALACFTDTSHFSICTIYYCHPLSYSQPLAIDSTVPKVASTTVMYLLYVHVKLTLEILRVAPTIWFQHFLFADLLSALA